MILAPKNAFDFSIEIFDQKVLDFFAKPYGFRGSVAKVGVFDGFDGF